MRTEQGSTRRFFYDLTVQNGNTTACGGGICAEGDIMLERVVLQNNQAGSGGGLCNFFEGSASYTVFRGNTASDWGGAIDNDFAIFFAMDSLFYNNSTPGDGGAVSNFDGFLQAENSTFTHNNANFGGAAYNGEQIFSDSTIYGNAPDVDDTAIFNAPGSSTVQFTNTILANGPNADCSSTTDVVSNGNNIESGTSCGLMGAGDQQSTDALLDALADNGGPTMTHALLAGSPAIDAIADSTSCPVTDQRGEPRPADGDGDGTAECDIGAFEVQPVVGHGIVPLFGDDIGRLPDLSGNGYPEVVRLERETNGVINSEIRDSNAGTSFGGPTFLGPSFEPWQILAWADTGGPVSAAAAGAQLQSGSPQSVVAVLATGANSNDIIVQVRDAQTGTRRSNVYFLGSTVTPVRMAMIPDMNDNGAAEIAVLATRNSDGAFLVQVRDSLTSDRLQNAYFLGPAFTPLDLAIIPDTDGDGNMEIAVLAVKDSDGRFLVQVRNAMGAPAPRNLFYLGPTFSPKSVMLVPDSDGDGTPEIGVLATKNSDGRILVQAGDAFGTPDPRNIFVLATGYEAIGAVALEDADGNDGSEIAVLAKRTSDGKMAIDVRNIVLPRNPRAIFFMYATFEPDALIAVDDRDGNGIPDFGVLATRTSDQRRRTQFKNASGPVGTKDIWLAP